MSSEFLKKKNHVNELKRLIAIEFARIMEMEAELRKPLPNFEEEFPDDLISPSSSPTADLEKSPASISPEPILESPPIIAPMNDASITNDNNNDIVPPKRDPLVIETVIRTLRSPKLYEVAERMLKLVLMGRNQPAVSNVNESIAVEVDVMDTRVVVEPASSRSDSAKSGIASSRGTPVSANSNKNDKQNNSTKVSVGGSGPRTESIKLEPSSRVNTIVNKAVSGGHDSTLNTNAIASKHGTGVDIPYSTPAVGNYVPTTTVSPVNNSHVTPVSHASSNDALHAIPANMNAISSIHAPIKPTDIIPPIQSTGVSPIGADVNATHASTLPTDVPTLPATTAESRVLGDTHVVPNTSPPSITRHSQPISAPGLATTVSPVQHSNSTGPTQQATPPPTTTPPIPTKMNLANVVKAAASTNLFLQYRPVIRELTPPKAVYPAIIPVVPVNEHEDYGMLAAEEQLIRIKKLLKPSKLMTQHTRMIDNLKESCSKYQDMLFTLMKDNVLYKKYVTDMEKESRRVNAQLFLLRKKFLKILNGLDGLPIVLAPTEDEMQLLRDKIEELTREDDLYQEKIKTKREQLYQGAIAPLEYTTSKSRRMTAVSKRSDSIVPSEISYQSSTDNSTSVDIISQEEGLDRKPMTDAEAAEKKDLPPPSTLLDEFKNRTMMRQVISLPQAINAVAPAGIAAPMHGSPSDSTLSIGSLPSAATLSTYTASQPSAFRSGEYHMMPATAVEDSELLKTNDDILKQYYLRQETQYNSECYPDVAAIKLSPLEMAKNADMSLVHKLNYYYQLRLQEKRSKPVIEATSITPQPKDIEFYPRVAKLVNMPTVQYSHGHLNSINHGGSKLKFFPYNSNPGYFAKQEIPSIQPVPVKEQVFREVSADMSDTLSDRGEADSPMMLWNISTNPARTSPPRSRGGLRSASSADTNRVASPTAMSKASTPMRYMDQTNSDIVLVPRPPSQEKEGIKATIVDAPTTSRSSVRNARYHAPVKTETSNTKRPDVPVDAVEPMNGHYPLYNNQHVELEQSFLSIHQYLVPKGNILESYPARRRLSNNMRYIPSQRPVAPSDSDQQSQHSGNSTTTAELVKKLYATLYIPSILTLSEASQVYGEDQLGLLVENTPIGSELSVFKPSPPPSPTMKHLLTKHVGENKSTNAAEVTSDLTSNLDELFPPAGLEALEPRRNAPKIHPTPRVVYNKPTPTLIIPKDAASAMIHLEEDGTVHTSNSFSASSSTHYRSAGITPTAAHDIIDALSSSTVLNITPLSPSSPEGVNTGSAGMTTKPSRTTSSSAITSTEHVMPSVSIPSITRSRPMNRSGYIKKKIIRETALESAEASYTIAPEPSLLSSSNTTMHGLSMIPEALEEEWTAAERASGIAPEEHRKSVNSYLSGITKMTDSLSSGPSSITAAILQSYTGTGTDKREQATGEAHGAYYKNNYQNASVIYDAAGHISPSISPDDPAIYFMKAINGSGSMDKNNNKKRNRGKHVPVAWEKKKPLFIAKVSHTRVGHMGNHNMGSSHSSSSNKPIAVATDPTESEDEAIEMINMLQLDVTGIPLPAMENNIPELHHRLIHYTPVNPYNVNKIATTYCYDTHYQPDFNAIGKMELKVEPTLSYVPPPPAVELPEKGKEMPPEPTLEAPLQSIVADIDNDTKSVSSYTSNPFIIKMPSFISMKSGEEEEGEEEGMVGMEEDKQVSMMDDELEEL